MYRSVLNQTCTPIALLVAVLSLATGCGTSQGAEVQVPTERTGQPTRLDSQHLDQHPNAAVLQWVSEHPTWSQGWAELTRRMKAGQLSDTDALAGMRILIACLEAQPPTGNPVAFSRADLFVAELHKAGLIDDPTLRTYAQAFIGDAFQFSNARAANGSRFMRVYGWLGTNVEEMQGSGLPYRLIWQVREVRVAGEPITTSRIEYGLNGLNIILDPQDYAIGTHRIEVMVEAGLALREDSGGFDQMRTGPEDWPSTRLRWQASQQATFTIYGPTITTAD